jgi:tetratricopeptide (TPR) repeat protein
LVFDAELVASKSQPFAPGVLRDFVILVLGAVSGTFLGVRPLVASPTFVGAAACGSCHKDELKRWTGSHHQLAMQPANPRSVLGNFNHTTFSNLGVSSRFFRRGAKFMVRTDGPDGALHDYEIKYAFGIYPLQQYLIAMPGGRLQALGIAWDSRSPEAGGGRWFFLYPARKIRASDPLHWTGIDQTWNYMCADCHSTNVRKNYDEQKRSYSTTFAEIDVSCEACHGPGSDHVAWTQKRGDWNGSTADKGLTVALEDRTAVVWTIDPATGNARRSTPRISENEIMMCARCHARRGQIHEDYVHGQPVGDDYRVALLDSDLYFPDGQIKEEVYEYGSFLQSRMFHEGVTCSDCHEPHGLALRAEGNHVCLQCHAGNRYDSARHHFHKPGAAGSRCVECHMPTRTYMVIDARRDHSIRIPRPDLTLRLGVPNACNQCHADKSAQWATDSVQRWYGHTPEGFQHYAETFRAALENAPGAERALKELAANTGQPAIARATALSRLAGYSPSPSESAVRGAVADRSALMRRAAAAALSSSDPQGSASTLGSLLGDPVRSVRIETAEVLAPLDARAADPRLAAARERATQEYIAAQELNADRPESHLDLALLFANRKEVREAEAQLKDSLSLDPTFVPSAVNLADLYRSLGREADGEATLRTALEHSPSDPALLYALGLSMARQGQHAKALNLLATAASGEPPDARYAYVYAVALNDAGQRSAAIDTLERSIKSHPYDRDSLTALVIYLEQNHDRGEAVRYARRLLQLEPENQGLRQMLDEPADSEKLKPVKNPRTNITP